MIRRRRRPLNALEREQIAHRLVKADLVAITLTLAKAIDEAATVIGEPWDTWRQRLVAIRSDVENLRGELDR